MVMESGTRTDAGVVTGSGTLVVTSDAGLVARLPPGVQSEGAGRFRQRVEQPAARLVRPDLDTGTGTGTDGRPDGELGGGDR
jgi:hypothetical protein